ncbi:uncharacterized protein LOC110907425 [Helianthus annuus]|uniref:uncharacterized protein LOC110907425 n=1 Tax=Helianthus annuus TaxID=4232 RepID=UPI000B905A50|nr:uncharacterized protein LOC110907425 [Helianthus annuus]
MRRDFLWGATPEKDKMKWVSWKNTMTPMDFGGMGFGSLQMANLAMLSKWWWRFKTDRGRLWRKVVWAIHTLFRVSPGRQKEVSFWKDRWLFEEPLCNKFPRLFSLESNKNAMISERVSEPNGSVVLSTAWSREPHSFEECSEFDALIAAVQSYGFGSGADRWEWVLDANGEFSVNSIRKKAESLLFSDLGLEFEWNSWTPIKVNFLIWRIVQDKVPTIMALARRNINVPDVRCKLCGDEEESALHLFGTCRITNQIWEFIVHWCRIRPIYVLELKDLAAIHKRNRGSNRWKKVVYMVIQTALWVIWKHRNDAVFHDKQINVARIKGKGLNS